MTDAGLIDPYDRVKQLLGEIDRLHEAELYEKSLIDFIEYTWPVVEPATPFVRGWAIDAICEHLEAVTSGEINRLLINVPPGFTKSLITDVFWPAWEWGPKNMPHMRYVCASYAQHLTIRDNNRFRNIINNRRYKAHWAHRFGSKYETKIKIENDKTGWKFATSVGGTTGGERGNRFIIDDGNNPQDMESSAVRLSTNHWFIEVVPDRLNNITVDAIIGIQQRLHEDDISGMALSKDLGYTHLMIPMEYDPGRHCITSIGWQDPRGCDDDGTPLSEDDREKNDGELAWPERFPPAAVAVLKQKGPYAYAGQYQQSPEPRGGGIFKRDWWRQWDAEKANDKFPPFDFILASLDTAYTEKEENDPSALTIWGTWQPKGGLPCVMLIDAWRKRLEIHGPEVKQIEGETDQSYFLRAQEQWGLVEWVHHSCRKYKADRLLIEAKAAGHSVAQELTRLYSRSAFGVQIVEPRGDKVARAYAVQHLFSEGMVYAPVKGGFWIDRANIVIDEAASFPKASHDDLVDSMTQALRYFRDNNFAMRSEEIAAEQAEMIRYRKPSSPLYPV